MNVDLPGRPKTHLYLGLVVALVGVGVGAYAYTGDRVYRIEFLAVALFGLALIVGGSTLAGVGQANRPRMGGPVDEEEPSLLDELRAAVFGGDGDEEAEPVTAKLECPSCEHVFEEEGHPPFETACPSCEHEDAVRIPDDAPSAG